MKKTRNYLTLLVFISASMFSRGQSPVTITEQPLIIPTYLANPPDLNPMFYFGKGLQGAEGRIYPYSLYDNLTNRKSDKTYQLIYIWKTNM